MEGLIFLRRSIIIKQCNRDFRGLRKICYCKHIRKKGSKNGSYEFGDMAVENIMSSIGEDIEVGTRPLDAGLSNLGRVNAASTEDNIPGEGKIFFDIRFTVYHKETEMKFLINLEAQHSSDPDKLGYHYQCKRWENDKTFPKHTDLYAGEAAF